MATYRVYQNRVTYDPGQYDPENPAGSGNETELTINSFPEFQQWGFTYADWTFGKEFFPAVSLAGWDDNVRDTIVIMEEGSYYVPFYYYRMFFQEYARKGEGIVSYLDTFYAKDNAIYFNPIRYHYTARPCVLNDCVFDGLGTEHSPMWAGWTPVTRRPDGTETRRLVYPDRFKDEDRANNYARIDARFWHKNVDLVAAPAVEGKVWLELIAPTDKARYGYPNPVRSPAFDNYVNSPEGWSTVGVIYRPTYSVEYMDVKFGVYMPFKKMTGINIKEGPGECLRSFKAVHGVAAWGMSNTYEGWVASPLRIERCVFYNINPDLRTTAALIDCTFEKCTASAFKCSDLSIQLDSGDFYSGGISRPGFANYKGIQRNQLFNPITEILNAYGICRSVDRCVVRDCVSSEPFVIADIISNSVFIDNKCGFPARGLITNCAFVDNRPVEKPLVEATLPQYMHTFVINSYIFGNEYGTKERGISNFGLDPDLVGHVTDYKRPTYPYAPIMFIGGYWNGIRENSNDSKDPRLSSLFFYSCVFDSVPIGSSAYRCLKEDRPATLDATTGLINPAVDFDLLCAGSTFNCFGRFIPAFGKDGGPHVDSYAAALFAGTEYKQAVSSSQNTGFDHVDRHLLDEDIISIGPVSGNIPEGFTVIKTRVLTGFGVVKDSRKICRTGDTVTIDVDACDEVLRVVVNGNDVDPSRHIAVKTDRQLVKIDVYTNLVLYVSTSASKSEEYTHIADGSIEHPFACVSDVFAYLARRTRHELQDWRYDSGYDTGNDHTVVYADGGGSKIYNSTWDEEPYRSHCLYPADFLKGMRVDIYVKGSGPLEERLSNSEIDKVNFDLSNLRVYIHVEDGVDLHGINTNGPEFSVCIADGKSTIRNFLAHGTFEGFTVDEDCTTGTSTGGKDSEYVSQCLIKPKSLARCLCSTIEQPPSYKYSVQCDVHGDRVIKLGHDAALKACRVDGVVSSCYSNTRADGTNYITDSAITNFDNIWFTASPALFGKPSSWKDNRVVARHGIMSPEARLAGSWLDRNPGEAAYSLSDYPSNSKISYMPNSDAKSVWSDFLNTATVSFFDVLALYVLYCRSSHHQNSGYYKGTIFIALIPELESFIGSMFDRILAGITDVDKRYAGGGAYYEWHAVNACFLKKGGVNVISKPENGSYYTDALTSKERKKSAETVLTSVVFQAVGNILCIPVTSVVSDLRTGLEAALSIESGLYTRLRRFDTTGSDLFYSADVTGITDEYIRYTYLGLLTDVLPDLPHQTVVEDGRTYYAVPYSWFKQ